MSIEEKKSSFLKKLESTYKNGQIYVSVDI